MSNYMEVIFAVAIILLAVIAWWYASVPSNLPPGPVGLPFVGCLHRVAAPTAHLTLERWSKRYGPVFSFYQASRLFVVLSSYDAMQEALKSDAFAGRAPFIPSKGRPQRFGLLTSEGARWKEQRRFSLSTLRDFGFGRPILEPKVILETQELVTFMDRTNGEPFDPQSALSTASSNVISSMIFGHRFDDNSEVKHYLHEINYRISVSQSNHFSLTFICNWLSRLLSPISAKAKRFLDGREKLFQFLQEEIAEARKLYDPSESSSGEPECLVHAFDKAAFQRQGEYFDDAQLLSLTSDLFLAGSDTTATSMRWALFYMAANPKIQEKVHDEIVDAFGSDEFPSYANRGKVPYTEATLMEIQRSATLLPLSVTHRTVEKTTLMGYHIPEDAWVAPTLWTVHRDPAHYPNPDAFDPAHFLDENGSVRRDLPFVPFGSGKRICLGESLARMELFIYFASLMQQFRFYFPTDDYVEASPFVGFLRSPPHYLVCAQKRG